MQKNNITISFTRRQMLLLMVIVITSVAGASFLRTRASFIGPSVAPSSSDQDFPENIAGANSADNDFDSSAVTANADGSIVERLENFTDYMAERDRNDYTYGRGWVASSSGDASVVLSHKTCEEADGWVWFEDGNGDGDTIDDKDGICVATSTTYSAVGSWNGMDYSGWADNTYLAAYTCAGSFPNGYVATYSGFLSTGAPDPDNVWNDGDCALCQADCYDGRKDLPDQIGQDGAAYPGKDNLIGGIDGPLTPEVLANWKGTKLPTAKDFFGFCGASTGDADNAEGDSLYHSSGASSDKTIGDYGHNAGRGANSYDEYIDLSNTSYEWLSEPFVYNYAQLAGSLACSYVGVNFVYNGYRFRAVFRP